MDEELTIGEWIRLRRRVLDLTQDALANLSGLSVATIRKIESGERRPSRQSAELMARALEVPPEKTSVFLRLCRSQAYFPPAELQLADDRYASQPIRSVVNTRPAESQASPPLRLPVYATPFSGRGAELAQIVALLSGSDCRLLTLTGPGGMGKTRLAIEAARRLFPQFPFGVYFVPLAALTTSTELINAIAEALNFRFTTASKPERQLAAYLAARKGLIVLDNMEHLLTSAPLLVNLLAQAPGLRFLVTSQERLALSGEWVFEISGLPYPGDQPGESGASTHASQPVTSLLQNFSAVELFVSSATRTNLAFTLDETNVEAVLRICHLVDGTPLAIELAASWVRTLPVEEIAREIEHNLDFLAAAARDVPERHRSLRAVFRYAWSRLSPSEQDALSRLAVFRGSFDRQAARILAGANLDVLASFMDKSLLQRADTNRYSLHELVRQYALEFQTDPAALQSAHADYFADRLVIWAGGIKSAQQVLMLEEMSHDQENIRQAWEWMALQGQASRLEQCLFAIWFYYESMMLFPQGLSLCQMAVDQLLPGKENKVRAACLGCVAWFLERLGRHEQAQLAASEARELSQPTPTLFVDLAFSIIAIRTGQFIKALCVTSAMLERGRAAGDWWTECVALHEMGYTYVALQQPLLAEKVLRDALQIARRYGEPRRLVITLYNLAMANLGLHRLEQAEAVAAEALASARQVGDRRYICHALRTQANLRLAQGRPEDALACVAEALALVQDTGDLPLLDMLHAHQVKAALAANDLVLAQTALTELFQQSQAHGLFSYLNLALAHMAEFLNRSGYPMIAQELYGYLESVPDLLPETATLVRQGVLEGGPGLTTEEAADLRQEGNQRDQNVLITKLFSVLNTIDTK